MKTEHAFLTDDEADELNFKRLNMSKQRFWELFGLQARIRFWIPIDANTDRCIKANRVYQKITDRLIYGRTPKTQ